MKIGILTLFHGNANWGGVLQGYALKNVLESSIPNAEVDIIRYRSKTNIIYKGNLQRAKQYSPVVALKKWWERIFDKRKRISRYLAKRRRIFKQFRDTVYVPHVTYTDAMLKELADDYDCLICGSDQIWNPNVARPAYFLQGVEGCHKVAYAASIARDDLSPRERKVILPLICKFDDVSVREKTAQEFLTRYIGDKKEIHEVLDPALVYTREDWEKLISDRPVSNEKYALAFFFSDSLTYRNHIQAYCNRKGLKLKYIPFCQNKFMKSDLKGCGEALWDIGPLDFLHLFRDAECVFTDSFHGSVFSLLFEKPFCVFERDKKSKTSKNSRLYGLLRKFELSDRLVRGDFITIMESPVDFTSIREKLVAYRADSLDFLVTAVNKTNEKIHVPARVDLLPKHRCVGCGLCVAVCPKNCITMARDEEGFSYPEIDIDVCINCGLCSKQCVGVQTPIST